MNKGFTLIELLVVVLIIGILSAVALPQYQKSVAKARASEALTTANAWAKAQSIFRLENGYYTSDLSALSIDMPNLRFFNIGSGSYGSGMMLRLQGGGQFGCTINYIDFTLYPDGTMYGCCFGDDATCRNVMPCAGYSGCRI